MANERTLRDAIREVHGLAIRTIGYWTLLLPGEID